MRSRILGLTKSLIKKSNSTRLGAKVLQLIAEERELALAEEALRIAGPILKKDVDLSIVRGPFKGLTYPGFNSVGSTLWPKLVGSYEIELTEVVERIIAADYSTVVDIGAAEGYYAIGLTRRMPSVRTIAFEGNPQGRAILADMAQRNGVADRVQIEGWCSVDVLKALAATIGGRAIVICDAEGSEYDLLLPQIIPKLSEWDILIELHHRGTVGDCRQWLEREFGATHDIEYIDVESRRPSMFPELAAVPERLRKHVLFERTDQNGWAFLRSRDS